MLTVVVGAVATLLGVALGGATRAWEAGRARRMDAEALLSALAAEVEAVTRLINHRRFLAGMVQIRDLALEQVESGKDAEAAIFMVISLEQDYFAAYNAALPKIGLLHPYWADRITRFYTFAKAVTENYHPRSAFQQGITASAAVEVITNDLMLLNTVVMLGNHISADARKVKPPKGVDNPFGEAPQASPQPDLPASQPALANREAGATASNQ